MIGMKEYIRKKRIFAVVFMVVIAVFSVVNLVHSVPALKECVTGEESSVAELDTAINENLYERMKFVEIYAYIQTLLDKRECNNFSYIKDEQGFLHYASFFREEDTRLFEYAVRVKRLQDSVAGKGTKVLFVVPPGKYSSDYNEFRMGMPVNDPNAIVDELMLHLNRLGIETLDLRESLPNQQLSYEETFFKTDHHWTIPAAFYAMGEIVNKIEECFGEDLDPEDYYTELGNYEVVNYEKGMFGSMGRKTGAHFCGLEDFTAIWPRFSGEFYREYIMESGARTEKQGSFAEVLMKTEILTETRDIYSNSQYSLYLDGLSLYEKIVNQEKPDGCSIFMIRDSYMSPVMAFLMPMCGEIHAMWSLEETEELDVETYLEEHTFDYIIVEVYPYNIESSAFNYFKGTEGGNN